MTRTPAFEYSQLDERIYAGRAPVRIADVKQLMKLGVTHILDLREDHEWRDGYIGQSAVTYAENRLKRLNIAIPDMQAPYMDEFDKAVEFLDQTLRHPEHKVYVHCRAGRERTAAILMAYYCFVTKKTPREALNHLQLLRPSFRPLPHQLNALRRWRLRRLGK